ncbi:TniQ family protein [Stutzerimonas nitrititolerans]|uniref:TniQ family protein n=1 Tax=Stutzerimonas nitrititolerans TaxID=2482751 RepID=UPI0028AD9F9A|nr:TniQ family protein [Stutzerimonas nitrititolerans]
MLSSLVVRPQAGETINSLLARDRIVSGSVSRHFHDAKFGINQWHMNKQSIAKLSELNTGATANRLDLLLSCCTGYDVHAYLTTGKNVQYSSNYNFATRFVRNSYIAHHSIKICLRCSKDDVEQNGFSYWRKVHQFHRVTVCSLCNLRLVDRCQACAKRFSIFNETNDGFWHNCTCGQNFNDWEESENFDIDEHRYSSFIAGIYQSDKRWLGIGFEGLADYTTSHLGHDKNYLLELKKRVISDIQRSSIGTEFNSLDDELSVSLRVLHLLFGSFEEMHEFISEIIFSDDSDPISSINDESNMRSL